MRIVYLFYFALMFPTSCASNPAPKQAQKILFYSRGTGSNNGVYAYLDNLVITNYENNIFSIGQFYQIAKQYIDTVKASLPVRSVTFMGLKQGDELPPTSTDYIDEQHKLRIISIDFMDKLDSLNRLQFYGLTLWINNNAYNFTYGKLNKNYMDTLLQSKVPFDNTKIPYYHRPNKG